MINTKKISDNIRKFRELKGYTIEYISDELEMTLSNYSKMECGEADLTISKLGKLSSLLNISPSELMNFDATTIFNVSHSSQVNNGKSGSIHNYTDENTRKYIKMLENENERLRRIIE